MTSKDDILVSKCQYPDEEDDLEEDMTIGIGFRCRDGIIIAGDRQRNKGDSARSVTKVKEFDFRERLSGVFVGAGTSSCVEMVFDEINNSLKGGMQIKEVQKAVDEASKEIYKRHSRLPGKKKDPHFSMLIGLWSEEEDFALLSAASDTPARIVNDSHRSIGSGSRVADCLIGIFYPHFDGYCEDATLISVMAIKMAKEYDPSCGGGTNIIGLLEDATLVKPKNSRAVVALEDRLLNFLDSLKPMFSHGSEGQDFSRDFDESTQDLKADLKKFRKEYRRDPLLVHRFPRPFSKSHFEQA
jgi:hypothetical protein